MKEEKKNRNAYLHKYNRDHYKRIVSLVRTDDEELMKKINSVESISDYVYSLIKKDIYGDNHEWIF